MVLEQRGCITQDEHVKSGYQVVFPGHELYACMLEGLMNPVLGHQPCTICSPDPRPAWWPPTQSLVPVRCQRTPHGSGPDPRPGRPRWRSSASSPSTSLDRPSCGPDQLPGSLQTAVRFYQNSDLFAMSNNAVTCRCPLSRGVTSMHMHVHEAADRAHSGGFAQIEIWLQESASRVVDTRYQCYSRTV